jgi:hypothetical protein
MHRGFSIPSFCDFSAGMGDILSGGLTKRFRDAAGYGDRVNTSSDDYGAGQYAGEIVTPSYRWSIPAPSRARCGRFST